MIVNLTWLRVAFVWFLAFLLPCKMVWEEYSGRGQREEDHKLHLETKIVQSEDRTKQHFLGMKK